MKEKTKKTTIFTSYYAIYTFVYMVVLVLYSKSAVETGSNVHLSVYLIESLFCGIGFLMYPVISHFLKNTKIITIIMSAMLIAGSFVGYFTRDVFTIKMACALTVLALGYLGGMAYIVMTKSVAQDVRPGFSIGVGGAIAVVLQFMLQTGYDTKIIESILTVPATIALIILTIQIGKTGEEEIIPYHEDKSVARIRLSQMIVLCICLISLSAYFDEQVAVSISYYTYLTFPRLFAAFGVIITGLLWEYKDHIFSKYLMMAMALFALLIPVMINDGRYGIVIMSMFYTYVGGCIAYFNLSFMYLAVKYSRPWVAVMYRVLDNLLTVLFLLTGIGHLSLLWIMVISVVLLGISAFMILFVSGSGEEEESQTGLLTDEEKMQKFADKFGLTDREEEVLKCLLTGDDKTEVIASQLGISRRTLTAHTTSIYHKTDTSSRIGLMRKYMELLK